jgi:hypothetical protein
MSDDQTRIYDNEADSRGPMYITIGDGGNREGLALKYAYDCWHHIYAYA